MFVPTPIWPVLLAEIILRCVQAVATGVAGSSCLNLIPRFLYWGGEGEEEEEF